MKYKLPPSLYHDKTPETWGTALYVIFIIAVSIGIGLLCGGF